MAAHAIVRGLWTKIEPRPAMLRASAPSVEIIVSATEPDLLDRGLTIDQEQPTTVPSGSGDLWARIVPSSAFSAGELRSLEAMPAD
jgi:hypothetical protein